MGERRRGAAGLDLAAPTAKRVPAGRSYHGDRTAGPYAWLADSSDADTVAYLMAENACTEVATAHLAGLRETIYAEIKGRTKQTDLSVPLREGGWWYYSRTVEGQQYAIRCRSVFSHPRQAAARSRGPRPRPAPARRRRGSRRQAWPAAAPASAEPRRGSASARCVPG